MKIRKLVMIQARTPVTRSIRTDGRETVASVTLNL